ncbi:MAG: hypothetical protein AAF823_04955 [Planctomycetota bacterium]
MTSRDRRAILLGGGTLAIALFAWYVVLPGIDRWQAAREQVAQHESVLSDLDRKLDRRDAIAQRLEAKYGNAVHEPTASIDAIRNAFPEEVRDLLQKSGIEYETIELQPEQRVRDTPGIALVSVRIAATTNPNAIANLLAKSAEADRVILVNSLQMTQQRGTNWSITLVLVTPAKEVA